MIPKRLRPTLLSGGIAMALVTSLLAAPTGALAATANVVLNGGTSAEAEKTRAATPESVSPGKVAGFYVSAKNLDTANLPTFFMTASSLAEPVGAYWYTTDVPGINACQTKPLRCDFGTFGPGTEVVVVAAFTVPTATSKLTDTKNCRPTSPNAMERGYGLADTPATESAWVCVDFKFASSQGNVPGKNKSRGDEFHWFDLVAADGNPRNDAAQFPFCDLSVTPNDCDESLLSLSNDTSLSNSPRNRNLQYTSVLAPGAAFNSAHGTSGIHVRDGGDFDIVCEGPCAITVAANGGFLGETSQIDVNSNQQFDDWIVTTIGMLGVNVNHIDGVVHTYTDELGGAHTDILDWCPSSRGPDATTPDEGCFWAVTGQGNTAINTIWTHYNGNMKNF